jgi:hypothetical protein
MLKLNSKERKKMLDTTKWASFPLSVDGVNFVSKLDIEGSFYPQILNMPKEVFEKFHVEMIHSLIGNPSLMTRKELEKELDRVNDGATQALICLA